MTSARQEPAADEDTGRETIEELFEALESPLLSYATRLLAGGPQAEDIVQEAFLKLHGQFQEVREPRRWLYRTVHNLALNQIRQATKIVPMPEHESAETTSEPEILPDEQIARWEGIGLVRLSLGSLDERSREIVHLKFNEDLSYKEIAARTGLTTGHVGYLLHHALKTIATELARTGLLP